MLCSFSYQLMKQLCSCKDQWSCWKSSNRTVVNFNSLVALLFTLVAKLSLCGWIVSTTGQFTCNVRGPSNILRHNMCYGSWPLIDSSVKDEVHVNVCGLTQVTLICILSSEVYNGSTGKNGRFLFTLFLLCLCFLVLLFYGNTDCRTKYEHRNKNGGAKMCSFTGSDLCLWVRTGRLLGSLPIHRSFWAIFLSRWLVCEVVSVIRTLFPSETPYLFWKLLPKPQKWIFEKPEVWGERRPSNG